MPPTGVTQRRRGVGVGQQAREASTRTGDSPRGFWVASIVGGRRNLCHPANPSLHWRRGGRGSRATPHHRACAGRRGRLLFRLYARRFLDALQAMITERDIYGSANILLKEYGDGAMAEAQNRLAEFREAGHTEAAAV